MAFMQLYPTRLTSPCSLLWELIAAAAALLRWQTLGRREAAQHTTLAELEMRHQQGRLLNLHQGQHIDQLLAGLRHCRNLCRGSRIDSSSSSSTLALLSGNGKGETHAGHLPLTWKWSCTPASRNSQCLPVSPLKSGCITYRAPLQWPACP